MKISSIGALISLLMLAGCSKPPKNLVVGSKRALENSVLGEILAQHIQNKLGTPVDRRTELQGSMIAHQALLSGEIDLYAEDSGTAYYSIFRMPVNKDLDILNSRVVNEYQNVKIRWMAPFGCTSAFVVAALKEKVSASTLSNLVEADKPETVSCTLEFDDRRDGFPELSAGYKLRLSGSAKVVEPKLVADQVTRKLVHLGVVNSADPVLLDDKIKVIEDDRKMFASYPVAAVVRESTLASNPQLEGALKQLEGRLSLETLRKLNDGIKTHGKTVAAAAAEFLQQAGLK